MIDSVEEHMNPTLFLAASLLLAPPTLAVVPVTAAQPVAAKGKPRAKPAARVVKRGQTLRITKGQRHVGNVMVLGGTLV
ncbi:MAG: hypothetical protein KC766_09245, partial [Myxococcales bacterium]|nr:hypothetical protein [Myxococcales bacterium]